MKLWFPGNYWKMFKIEIIILYETNKMYYTAFKVLKL